MWKTLAVVVLAATLLAPAQAQALENEELLSLVAMPLAVAAVSEMTDVPVNQLMDVVTLLNDAAVTAPQFIEVVRYVPVALVVEDNQPDFVEFLRLREQEGLRGTAFVTSIQQQIPVYGVPEMELAVTRPRTIDVHEETFVPKPVQTRLAEVRRDHPHGGPPGQLKKVAGVQSGAEIVHGDRDRPGRKLRKQKVETHERERVAKHGNNGNGKGKG
jgi:hypothetical protein